MTARRISRQIAVGKVKIGGGAPVSVQSMTNTKTADAVATLEQIRRLAQAGCDIVRLSVDNASDAARLPEITSGSPLPVVADIQFDYRSALLALEGGVAALRLNPGLVNDGEALRQVAEAALEHGAAIRVGANSGSVRPQLLRAKLERGMAFESAMAELLVESVLEQCRALEKFGFSQIKAALKSSSVAVTVEANRIFAERTDYPLHLGITEAGLPENGIVKSAVGIGSMLLSGIGDTIRVSLTADPVEEVIAAHRILRACGLDRQSAEVVACPTCGRTEINLPELADKVQRLIDRLGGKLGNVRKVAVMGCPVNGPGEAREADFGLAGSRTGQVIVFRRGEVIGAFSQAEGLAKLEELMINAQKE